MSSVRNHNFYGYHCIPVTAMHTVALAEMGSLVSGCARDSALSMYLNRAIAATSAAH